MMLNLIYKTILNNYIKKIDKELSTIRFKDPALQEMYSFSIGSGKRFRPLLTILASKSINGNTELAIKAGAALELLHKASLIHDDVLDKDEFRRGKRSFYSRYTEEKAIIMGDLLVSLAFQKMYSLRRYMPKERFASCYEIFLETYTKLCIGELQEEIYKEQTKIPRSLAEEVSSNKTASLIRACFRIGALTGNPNKEEFKALSDYGQQIGIIFQMINDLNSITGKELATKKNIYNDLKQKKKNMILAHALEHSKNLPNILKKKKISEEDLNVIIKIIGQTRSIQYTKTILDIKIKEAKSTLSPLRTSIVKKVFLKLTDEVKERWFWESK